MSIKKSINEGNIFKKGYFFSFGFFAFVVVFMSSLAKFKSKGKLSNDRVIGEQNY